jgi:primosomal protein N' (replication factor Y)
MHYYHVWVRSNRYRGTRPLTYSAPEQLAIGSIVRVPLQRQLVFGVVFDNAPAPGAMAVKPIEAAVGLPPLPDELLKTSEWLQKYYRASIGSVVQALLPAAIPQKLPDIVVADPGYITPDLPALTTEQAQALQAFTDAGTYLLHGRTGSGKTRLYQELATRAMADGKSVLILTPEISLTTQLAAGFAPFGTERVIVLHSAMTNAERFRAWRRIAAAKEPLVVIGARSALFSPLRNIGLIVVDESHEPAYKQEQEPRYHASRVASSLAQQHAARLILASATPSVIYYALAEERNRPIVRLTKLALLNDHRTEITVIDLKNRENFSRSAYLSDQLIGSMSESLKKAVQSLIYLNRRGTARVSLCQNCGWQSICPNCDLPLTYHGDAHVLRCHICNFVTNTPSTCPVCGHVELLFKNVGTKAIVDEVSRLFPDARISRFDSDNAKEDRYENNYSKIAAGDIDILIGTQTLVKGIDLPLLGTLGVVNADLSLQMPDYTATERTYQLINQVVGRIRRGHRATRAFIQTYEPDSALLRSALEDDWQDFYGNELAERRAFGYPPFVHLLKISCRRKSAKSAEAACDKLREHILKSHPTVQIDGPAPNVHEKFKDTYTWQLIIKAVKRAELLQIIDELPSTATSYDLDPLTLL